ncbi:GNAT family N-acetyltransferase [Paenibacillus campi]|uniref:GNAT family N-acetyltransferase n=1 Tax=Paenibacillus campi TaxID=3106031 RepID=UPI002AFF6BE1|nr:MULTISPECIES: GNAT family N-acetyltransferase [unclassified Paenibacillus]
MIMIREMNIADYAAMYYLWSNTEGMGLSEADTLPQIERYLERNPGCSYVAVNLSYPEHQAVIGTLLAGHDGRRAYLYHMAVAVEARGHGIAKDLLARSMEALERQGIDKAHIFVMSSNAEGKSFWAASGWEKRTALDVFSREIKSSPPN